MSTQRTRSLSHLLDASDEANTRSDGRRRSLRTWASKQGDASLILLLLAVLLVVGLVLGFVLPASDQLHGPYRRISAVIGWTYFVSWSVSFYPQTFLNCKRKTSVGLSFDFLLYNMLAFTCYATFTCSLFWSKSVQRAYNKRHAGQASKVQLNDAVFAVHAAFISFVTLLQVVYFDWRERKQRPSFAAVATCCFIIVCAAVYALAVAVAQLGWGGESRSGDDIPVLNWLDFLYFLSYVKVVTSILKYVPQVVLNIRRRSTKGWTIWNVILDLTGGLLSVLQLVLDCWNTGDWGGIRGYPVKFAIGFVSVFFDAIFILQHYVLYRPSRRKEGLLSNETPSAPLLVGNHVQGDGTANGEGWWTEREEGNDTRIQ